MLAQATVDYLPSEGREVLLVECDSANQDVLRAHQDVVPVERTDLDGGSGVAIDVQGEAVARASRCNARPTEEEAARCSMASTSWSPSPVRRTYRLLAPGVQFGASAQGLSRPQVGSCPSGHDARGRPRFDTCTLHRRVRRDAGQSAGGTGGCAHGGGQPRPRGQTR
jgi:hypothetical protein